MKTGANFTDQRSIKRLASEGMSVEDISHNLQINEDTIKSFMPKKGKGKNANKLADAFKNN